MPDSIEQLMFRCQVKDLVNTNPQDFRRTIDRFLQMRDYKREGRSLTNSTASIRTELW